MNNEIKLAEFQNIALAEMVKDVLNQHSIPFRERRDPIQTAYLIEESSAAGSYSILYVSQADYEEAERVIKGMV